MKVISIYSIYSIYLSILSIYLFYLSISDEGEEEGSICKFLDLLINQGLLN